MTDADAYKINRFYEIGKDDPDVYGKSKTAILVVGNIPSGGDIDDILWCIEGEAYANNGDWPNSYNFETIDGDHFAAYPGINKNGKFELLVMILTTSAIWIARQQRKLTVLPGRQGLSMGKDRV
jgi:hypothetical protein